MPVSFEFLPSSTHDIERVDYVGDAQVDSVGLPFGDELMHQSPLVIPDNELEENPGQQLVRIGANHVRSFVPYVLAGHRPNLFWQDKHGNPYTTYSYKGNNLQNPNIFETATSPSGFIFWGLQDGYAIERNVKASNEIRSLGVETEWIFNVGRLEKIPLEGELIGIETYKSEVLMRALGKAATNGDVSGESLDVSRIGDAAKALKTTDMYVTARAHFMPYRLTDLHNKPDKDKWDLLFHVRDALKLAGKDSPLDKLDSYDDWDLAEEYLYQYLPTQIGSNLATLHANELIHGFPHAGNISLTGGLLDLDSVKGKSINPEDELEPEDYARDAIYGLATLLEDFGADEEFFNLDDQAYIAAEQMVQENYIFAYVSKLNELGVYSQQTAITLANRINSRISPRTGRRNTLNTAHHMLTNMSQFDHFPTFEETTDLLEKFMKIGKEETSGKEIFNPTHTGALVGLLDLYSQDLPLKWGAKNNPFQMIDKTDKSIVITVGSVVNTMEALIEMYDLQEAFNDIQKRMVDRVLEEAGLSSPDEESLNQMAKVYLMSGYEEDSPFSWVYSTMEAAYRMMDPVVPRSELADALVRPENMRHFTGVRQMNAIGGHNRVPLEELKETAKKYNYEIVETHKAEPIYVWASKALHMLHPNRITHVFTDKEIEEIGFSSTELMGYPNYLAAVTDDKPNVLRIFSAPDPEAAHKKYILETAPALLAELTKIS